MIVKEWLSDYYDILYDTYSPLFRLIDSEEIADKSVPSEEAAVESLLDSLRGITEEVTKMLHLRQQIKKVFIDSGMYAIPTKTSKGEGWLGFLPNNEDFHICYTRIVVATPLSLRYKERNFRRVKTKAIDILSPDWDYHWEVVAWSRSLGTLEQSKSTFNLKTLFEAGLIELDEVKYQQILETSEEEYETLMPSLGGKVLGRTYFDQEWWKVPGIPDIFPRKVSKKDLLF